MLSIQYLFFISCKRPFISFVMVLQDYVCRMDVSPQALLRILSGSLQVRLGKICGSTNGIYLLTQLVIPSCS